MTSRAVLGLYLIFSLLVGSAVVACGDDGGASSPDTAVDAGAVADAGSVVTDAGFADADAGADVPMTIQTISAHVTGLVAGASVVLENNSVDRLSFTANGTQVFTTAYPAGATYAVTVLTQPTAQNEICTVTAGTGTLAASDVVVEVVCTASR